MPRMGLRSTVVPRRGTFGWMADPDDSSTGTWGGVGTWGGDWPDDAWTERDGRLGRTFVYTDFAEAFSFLTAVALVAQEVGHHPDLAISWNRVVVTSTTHDAGSTVTGHDRQLVERIDEVAGRVGVQSNAMRQTPANEQT